MKAMLILTITMIWSLGAMAVETGTYEELARGLHEALPAKKIAEKPDLGIPRPMISKISFQDDNGQPLPAEKFQSFMSQRPGEELDIKQLGADADKLRREYPEFVSITTRLEPSKVDPKKETAVVVEFLRKRFVHYVRVVAEPKAQLPEDLQSKLRIKAGRILHGGELKGDEEILRKELITAGYPKATVSSQVKVLDPERGTVEVVYTAKTVSRKATVAQVSIKGNHLVDAGDIEDVLVTNAGNGWTSWIEGMFDPDARAFNLYELENDTKRVEEVYKDKGFADVKVTQAYSMNDAGRVHAQIQITEGARYTVGRVNISGNEKITTATIAAQLSFRPGSPYSGKEFRKSMQKLREYYGERGYASMHVHIDYDIKSKEVKILVTEGAIQYIDRVEITGHQSIDEKVIRSYFDLKEGDRVNTKKISESIAALKKTGFFDEVVVNFHPTRPGAGKILVAVTEANKATFDVGFSYGTHTGLQGDVGYGLKKSGMDFSVRAIAAEEEDRLTLLFRVPRFMDTKLDLTAQGGYQRLDMRHYEKESIAARVMVEKEIIKNLTVGIGTRIEFIRIGDVEPGMPQEVFDASNQFKPVAGLVSTIMYDQEVIDEKGVAHDGYKVRMALLPSYADEEVYLKASATMLAHHTLAENKDGRKHVLTGRMTLGYASENTPFYDGLYAGGSGILRGSDRGGVTPKGSNLPGKALVGTGGYYSFPLYEDMFRGVLFVESVNVGNGFADLGSGLRVVSGVGVRANLEQTFIRSNIEGGFVFPAIKQKGDQFKPFYLMFGNYHPMYDL